MGEVRVVHGSADVHKLVQAAVRKVWPPPAIDQEDEKAEGKTDGRKNDKEEESKKSGGSEGFWSLETGQSILDEKIRSQVRKSLSISFVSILFVFFTT